MIKSAINKLNKIVINSQIAVAFCVQVLNTITVPMGTQYGTDSSTRRKQDHTVFGIIRDHYNKIIYWRDGYNPTLRKLDLKDIFNTNTNTYNKDSHKRSLLVTKGSYYVDMAEYMNKN